MSMVIDHIGIVVPRLEEGLDRWTRIFGYTQLTEPVVNARQGVRVVFLSKQGSAMVKLVEPTDVSVMAATERATLTMISCYPYLVDNQRIVVFAELVDG